MSVNTAWKELSYPVSKGQRKPVKPDHKVQVGSVGDLWSLGALASRKSSGKIAGKSSISRERSSSSLV